MILNLDIHKFSVMLTQYRRSKKFFHSQCREMQVNTGDFNNLFVPVRHQFSRLFLYKPMYMTKANPSGRMADFAKALVSQGFN